jgi:hypothetical protein
VDRERSFRIHRLGPSAEYGEAALEPVPLGSAEEVWLLVRAAWPGLRAHGELGWVRRRGLAIVCELWRGEGGRVDALTVHLEGEGDAHAAIAALCRTTGWTALGGDDAELVEHDDLLERSTVRAVRHRSIAPSP